MRPLLSLLLLAVWLMLNESASAGHLVMGAALALTLPLLLPRMATPRVGGRAGRPSLGRRVAAAARLAATVAVDIMRSNLLVARQVLGPERRLQPRFVWFPLALREPRAATALMGIVTLTPGTLSADLADDGRHVLIHALHLDDDAAADALVAEIRARYEAPLALLFADQAVGAEGGRA